MRERLNSLTFSTLLQACALAAILMLPVVLLAESNLRAADQIVRQAKAWNSAGKYEEARDALVRYLERDSRSVVVRLEYARTLSYLRQFPEALAEYQHVLKLEPENLEARVGVASVASWRGQFENALNLYRQILAENPGLHDALVGKAHTLVWLGRKDEAIAVFLEALVRNPSDRDVRRMLDELDVDVDAALSAAQRKAALSVRPEPQLAVLPPILPEELWVVMPTLPDPPAVAAAHVAEQHAAVAAEKQVKPPAPASKRVLRAPPPAAPSEAVPVEAVLPAPLLLQAATILIFLAGGALAYHTSLAHLRRRPLTFMRKAYELPPSSLCADVKPDTVRIEKSEQAATPEVVDTVAAPRKEKKVAKAENSAPPSQPVVSSVAAEPHAEAGVPAAMPNPTEVGPTQPAKADSLPVKIESTKVEAERTQPPAAPPLPNRLLWGRVLVVHPDEQVLEFTRRVLAGAGADVLALRRGEDALLRLEKSRQEKSGYDALLVNDRLPGGYTGMEIYRWVKQHQPGAERSVMLVHSGLNDAHTQQFLDESGALGVTAPFNVSDLIAMTRLALDKSKASPRA